MKYIDKKLEYKKDGRLLDEDGIAIMMDWEYPIMKRTAKIICKNGGRILNVGFGMGLIDEEIQKQNIKEHWIIESHPDVYKKMLEDGWHLKNNVKILFGDWRFFLSFLPKFDGVFIDTIYDDTHKFHMNVHNVLNINGVYSYFNLSTNKLSLDSINGFPTEKFTYDYEELFIDYIPDKQHENTDVKNYWSTERKIYYVPILTLK